jgi:hypothetical protein
MAGIADPTAVEACGAALIAAGFPQASYRPPDVSSRHSAHLGGCTPGWILAPVLLPGDWVRIFYRPEGVLGADTAAVQRGQLQDAYALALRAAGWETAMDRREGIPCLLARRVTL